MKKIKLIALASIFVLMSSSFTQTKGTCKKGMHWDLQKAQCVKNSKKLKISKLANKDLTNKFVIKNTAEQLINAIENNDASSILEILSKDTITNLNIIDAALTILPDNSANVRCMASSPDCGMSPTQKILKKLQVFIQKEEQVNMSLIDDLLYGNDMYRSNSSMQEHDYVSIAKNSTKNMVGRDAKTFAPQKFDPSSQFSGNGLVGNYFKASQTATIHDPSGKNSKNYTFKEVEENSNYSIDEQAPDGLEFIGSFMSSPKCPAGQMCTMVMKVTSLYGKLSKDTNAPGKRKNTKRKDQSSQSTQIDDDRFFHVDDPNYRTNRRGNLLGIRAPEDMPAQNKKGSESSQIYY